MVDDDLSYANKIAGAAGKVSKEMLLPSPLTLNSMSVIFCLRVGGKETFD